ncbi:hypothetical protein ES705_29149 [subsurface metagenome]
MKNLAKLRAALQGLSLVELRLVLRFVELLAKESSQVLNEERGMPAG